MDNIGDLIVWKIHLKIKEKVTKDINKVIELVPV